MTHDATSAAPIRHAWFDLARHDDPESEPKAGGGSDAEAEALLAAAADGDGESEDGDGADLGDAGKRALQRERADKTKARQEAAAAKRRTAELEAKVREFEDRDKTELDRATSKAEEAQKRADAATRRAVKAEVKALAAEAFADPTDADLLGDLSRYVDASGDIDTEQIQADLDDLLDRKPHLRKAAAEPERRQPRPDPGQGSRGPTQPTDFRTASKDELGSELAKYGFRQRW